MNLGPKTKAFFKRLKKEAQNVPVPPPIDKNNIVSVRQATKELFRDYAGPLPDWVLESSFKNYTFTLPEDKKVRAKIYTPENFNSTINSSVIFFQGNGFIFDMLDAHLPGFARMANTTNCQVIGIDTPLAPEHTAQEINDLSYAVVRYTFQHAEQLGANPENIILAGYSAGGNLVANIASKARHDKMLNIKQLLLLSPSLDLSLETRRDSPYADYQNKDESASTESIRRIVKLYYQDIEPKTPLISPMFEKDLTDMPPTTIVLAEFDGARGDGQAYAERLEAADVPVKVIICEGQTHNYFIARAVMGDLPDPAIVMGQALLDSNINST